MSHTDAYAIKLLKTDAPEFLRAVRAAARHADKSKRVVHTSLAPFEDNPLVLYAALFYARKRAVTVTVVPPVSNKI